jgi:hypothetical protein
LFAFVDVPAALPELWQAGHPSLKDSAERYLRFFLHLVDTDYLTPDPSPAGTIVNERNVLLAGEGCKREMGLRNDTLSFLPL